MSPNIPSPPPLPPEPLDTSLEDDLAKLARQRSDLELKRTGRKQLVVPQPGISAPSPAKAGLGVRRTPQRAIT